MATATVSGQPRRSTSRALWRVVRETVASCLRNRVTGLAAEVGFFALLSLPPLVLGLVGSIGYFGGWLGPETVADVRSEIVELARVALTERSVQQVIEPTLNDVLDGGRFELVSLGFVLSIWSGSRALNVYVDTITIMYGLSGVRGIVRTRLLSLSLYVIGLVLGTVSVPLVLAGPELVDRLLPAQLDRLNSLYWPLVLVGTIAFLATLYHVSVPVRTAWWRAVPGAGLAVAIWIGGSYLLRWIIAASVGSTSIYGPLAAPIVVMLWLYVLAIAVLIGAALNAAISTVWPMRSVEDARDAAPAPDPARVLTPVRPPAQAGPANVPPPAPAGSAS
ncbi:MAG: YihY/virulence factor BrkB family protein, partial [Actinomycetota bacterium]|nr:YihY/virulence factor BrkB family protein [Actinomycetota bacterium]